MHRIVGDSINDEDRHVVPGLSQPLVWVCDMQCAIGQWTGECETCDDSRDVMQVSESIMCRSINRWRVRAACQSLPPSWRQWRGRESAPHQRRPRRRRVVTLTALRCHCGTAATCTCLGLALAGPWLG